MNSHMRYSSRKLNIGGGNVFGHEFLEAIITKLDKKAEQLSVESTPTEFLDFFLDISDFHSKYLAHMLMEEREVLKAIWANFTDEELIVQHHRILSSFTPEKILRWFRFIVPALNPQERKIVHGGMKAIAPKVFFNELLEVIKAEMLEFAFANLVKSPEEKDLSNPLALDALLFFGRPEISVRFFKIPFSYSAHF